MLGSALQSANKKLVVNFPLQKVKDAVKEIFDKKGGYLIKPENINEAFNTYHFSIVKGLLVQIVDMGLVAIDENKTEIDITITNATGSAGTNAILQGKINEYLTLLGKVLQGEVLENSKGCIGLILIGLSSAMGYLLFH